MKAEKAEAFIYHGHSRILYTSPREEATQVSMDSERMNKYGTYTQGSISQPYKKEILQETYIPPLPSWEGVKRKATF